MSSINSVFGNIPSAPTLSTGNVDAVNPSSSSPSSVPPAIGGAATASISTAGQFFSQLQELSQSNPTEFKAVAGQLATNFQNAASQASGPQAKFLGNLANQFSQAAQTGTLQPPTAQGGQAGQTGQSGTTGGAHHHHHHGGGGGSAGSSSQSSQVQAAFQNAMNIVTQALQGGASSSTATPSVPPST